MSSGSVILVHPASEWGTQGDRQTSVGMPLSLLYLSGAIRDICADIVIFDAYVKGNDEARLARLLEEKQPVLVGINCVFSGIFPEVRRLAAAIKERFPETKIVLGGIHPTLYFREIMAHCPAVDAICLGESDQSFPLLLRYYQADAAAAAEPPEALRGVALRVGDRVVVREKAGYIEDIDALPMPGYEFFDFEQYRVNTSSLFNPRGIELTEVLMPLLTSRSCPNQCYFCAMRLVMGNRFRMRSAQNVFAEMRHLYDRYGINYFNIADDNFSFNRKRTLELCDLIVQSGMNICMSFWAGLMVRTLDREVIDAMCAAGGVRFNLAIESGSDFIRNTIVRKLCSREKIMDTIRALKEHDVLVNAFFMIGFPEDTEESLQDSIDLINELDMLDAIVLSKVNPLPGTVLFEQCRRDNLFLEKIEESQLWKGEHALAKSLIDGGGAGHFLIRPYALSLEKLREYDETITGIIKKRMARIAAAKMRHRLAAKGRTSVA